MYIYICNKKKYNIILYLGNVIAQKYIPIEAFFRKTWRKLAYLDGD